MPEPKFSVKFIQIDSSGTGVFFFDFDGGDADLSPRGTGNVEVPIFGKITGWRVTADKVCTAVFDIRKRTAGPFQVQSITGASRPGLRIEQDAEGTILTGWSPKLVAGDVLQIHLSEAKDVRRVNLQLTVEGAKVN